MVSSKLVSRSNVKWVGVSHQPICQNTQEVCHFCLKSQFCVILVISKDPSKGAFPVYELKIQPSKPVSQSNIQFGTHLNHG